MCANCVACKSSRWLMGATPFERHDEVQRQIEAEVCGALGPDEIADLIAFPRPRSVHDWPCGRDGGRRAV
jgi:hypothetical protein